MSRVRTFIKHISIFCCTALLPLSCFAAMNPPSPNMTPNAALHKKQPGLQFQVVKNHLNFNKSNIKKIATEKLGPDSYAIEITLNKATAAKLHDMTSHNIGKSALFVLDGKVITAATIRSGINSHLLITGFSQQQAEAFEQYVKSDVNPTKKLLQN